MSATQKADVMVMVRLMGGLGNQMFQYAAGRAMALRLGTELILDTSWFHTFGKRTKRPYELRRFRALESRPSWWQRLLALILWIVIRVTPRRGLGFVRALLRAIGIRALVHVDVPSFDSRVLIPARGITYLYGYWASEKYFVDFADVIRRELQFKDPPDAENAAMLQQIRACDSVAVHVRRGDYVSDPTFYKCDLAYYRRGIEEISRRVPGPRFFIFSDDPEWTAQNLKFDYPVTYVTHNVGKQDYEDLRLMMECKHFIIANSTFSWWGAWLSANPHKSVIAPIGWFSSATHDDRDLVPASWSRV